MEREILLVAIGCGRLPRVLDIAAEHTFVVFGALDETVFADLHSGEGGKEPSPAVYFYETG